MKLRHATACARCASVGQPRQLNELLQHDKNEPAILLCDRCLRLLKYADAKTWKWFRKYHDRLSQSEMKRRQTVEPSPYMTSEEVAVYLGIHPSTVYKLIRENGLPAFRICSDWRFVRKSIDKWMADRQKKTL